MKNNKHRRKILKWIAVIAAVIAALLLLALFVLHMFLGKMRFARDEDAVLLTEVLETESEAPPTAAEMYHPEDVVPVDAARLADTWTLLIIGEGSENASDGRAEETVTGETENKPVPGKTTAEENSATRETAVEPTPGETAVESASGAAAEETASANTAAEYSDLYGDAQAIILMTVNHGKEEVYFVTFDPEIYALVGAYGGHRLGSAYAAGGGTLLEQTIEENYGISIDQYAVIRLHDVARELEMEDFETIDLSERGVDVIEELVYSMSDVGPSKLAGYVSRLLPYVTHNMTGSDLMGILFQIPRIVGYVSVKSILPFRDMYLELEGYKVPDIGPTSRRLQDLLYGTAEAETADMEVITVRPGGEAETG